MDNLTTIIDKTGSVGKMVVDNFGDPVLLSKIWVDNFFTHMKPQYVSPDLRASVNETLRKRAMQG